MGEWAGESDRSEKQQKKWRGWRRRCLCRCHPAAAAAHSKAHGGDRYSYLSFLFPFLGIFFIFYIFFHDFLKINSEFKICKSSLELSW
jgi:hypothetical protein